MTARELVLTALRGEATPRPAVICPGGMMSFAVREAMAQADSHWPEAHCDAELMARLALTTQRETGFDNIGLPFCMTVEAEALGAEVDYGTADIQPFIVREPIQTVAEIADYRPSDPPARDRRPVVLEALRRCREAAPDVALVGSVVGPLSLAAQLLEASLLLRATFREPAAVQALAETTREFVTAFALAQLDAGADVIMVADPTATGEILGAARYAEFAQPYLDRLIADLRATGAPVILHVCGNVRAILPLLAATDVEAISLDETANVREARVALTRQRLMGNISGTLLEEGPPELIASNARAVLDAGVDILAPACGVVPCTPTAHLRQMVAQAARDAQ